MTAIKLLEVYNPEATAPCNLRLLREMMLRLKECKFVTVIKGKDELGDVYSYRLTKAGDKAMHHVDEIEALYERGELK